MKYCKPRKENKGKKEQKQNYFFHETIKLKKKQKQK